MQNQRPLRSTPQSSQKYLKQIAHFRRDFSSSEISHTEQFNPSSSLRIFGQFLVNSIMYNV